MRLKKKYKLYSLKTQNKSLDIPLRVLKFKRTKWKTLVQSVQHRYRLRLYILIKNFGRKKFKKFLRKSIKEFIFSLRKKSLTVKKILSFIGKYNNKLPKAFSRYFYYTQLKGGVHRAKKFPYEIQCPLSNTKIYIPQKYKRFSYFTKNKNSFYKKKEKSPTKSFDSYLSLQNLKTRVPLGKYERKNNTYKNSLLLQKYYYQLYDSNISFYQLKKTIFSKKKIDEYEYFLRAIFCLEFRLDVLLWRLRFFKSTYEARVFINNKHIKVNSKAVQGNYFLKKGDVIFFSKNLNYFQNLVRIKRTFLLKNFLEIDFYTNTVVVLQSQNEIPLNYFSFLIKKYFDLNKFRYSFK